MEKGSMHATVDAQRKTSEIPLQKTAYFTVHSSLFKSGCIQYLAKPSFSTGRTAGLSV
jgi:hypothetical protein